MGKIPSYITKEIQYQFFMYQNSEVTCLIAGEDTEIVTDTW